MLKIVNSIPQEAESSGSVSWTRKSSSEPGSSVSENFEIIE